MRVKSVSGCGSANKTYAIVPYTALDLGFILYPLDMFPAAAHSVIVIVLEERTRDEMCHAYGGARNPDIVQDIP